MLPYFFSLVDLKIKGKTQTFFKYERKARKKGRTYVMQYDIFDVHTPHEIVERKNMITRKRKHREKKVDPNRKKFKVQ